ncbi:nuclear transport factor 2 family protein [Aureibaculum sp. 2210JD6-5]|uniref:YybH family protein n=1 Tax=Aureibaculum sp. 2210JD6-5 TaxID=3103957 RepID=UPI002AAEEC0A|nr:nuclear transport factor 2 family protein [Aureibaculum sp. 2210JD6-5]MDY7395439.1 nuclear transport factor 2 family protein [Aureibaculum sp. 2210JD6-5]
MMSLRIKSLYLLLLLTVSVYGQEYVGKGEDITAILKVGKQFSKAYVDGDIAKLTSFYSEDGKIFPDKSDIIVGHEAIKKRWTLPKHIQIVSHKATPKEINVIDGYAYDYGYYEGSSKNSKNNTTTNFKGKYVIVWKKENQDWKMYLDMWNALE